MAIHGRLGVRLLEPIGGRALYLTITGTITGDVRVLSPFI